jgi:integrase
MLLFAALAGLRAGEIARLRRDAIRDDLDPPVLIVEDGKGGRQRVVPLHPELVAVLSELPSRGWLFGRYDGQAGHIPPHLVSHLCNRALRDAGTSSTLHTLRHRFATKVYANTLDLRTTQELLGHASPTTTAQYAAWTPAAGVDAVCELRI